MSKTDKTTPWEVRLATDSSMRVEDHDHRNGICDIDEEYVRTSMYSPRCEYRFRRQYYYTSGIYGRPKSAKIYRQEYNAKERTRLRNAISEMLKSPYGDNDFQNFPHRHSALWDAF